MTPYANIVNRFIRKIKQDKEYFTINASSEEELHNIIKLRSNELLDDAINELQLLISVQQDINLLDKDDVKEQFNCNLTSIEEDIISDMMYVKYMDEELVRLAKIQKYLGNDINVFSPAKERDSFVNMLEYKRKLTLNKIGNYNTRHRLTGKFLLAY